jgi:hypothetical protein
LQGTGSRARQVAHSEPSCELPSLDPFAGGPVSNPVRLFGSDSCTKGVVQVLRNGFWGSVCTTYSQLAYNPEVADVICRGLGIKARSPEADYSPSSSYSSTSTSGSLPAWVASYNCTGKESSFMECGLEFTNATLTR